MLSAILLFVPVAAAQSAGKDDGDLLNQTKRRQEVLAQRAEADIRDALKEAQKLDAVPAVERLKKVLASLDADDSPLSESKRDALKRMLKDRIRVVQATAGDKTAEDASNAAKDARRADEDRKTAAQERINQELKAIRKLQEDGKYEEATRRANELARRNADNPAAQASSRTNGQADRISEERRLRGEKERRIVGAQRDLDRSALLPAGDIEFPKDWAEKTAKRTASNITAKEKSILKALGTPVTVPFKDSPFEDVIEYLQTLTGQSIILDDTALREAGVKYNTPVTLNARDVTVRTVLRKVLADLGLAYIVKDETIQITTAVKAKETMTVRSYYIGDLLANNDFNRTPLANQITALQTAKHIADMITSTVDPASWQANGGLGTISFDARSLSLVVKQNAEVHFMIGGGIR